jgi:hypothetical protein
MHVRIAPITSVMYLCRRFTSYVHFLILQIYGAIDIDIILHGNKNLTEGQNVDIFTAVQTFIRNSHRFD